MTTSTAAPTTPRRVPRTVHAAEAILYAAMAALLFEVLPVPIVARLLLLFVLLGLFATLGITAQIRCWATFIAPAITPARVTSSLFIAASVLLATWLPEGCAARVARSGHDCAAARLLPALALG